MKRIDLVKELLSMGDDGTDVIVTGAYASSGEICDIVYQEGVIIIESDIMSG